MPEKPIVYFDTDISLGIPGAEIDDGTALMLLLNSSKIEVCGIGTVFGNTSIDNVNQNLTRMLSYLGKDTIPFGIGAKEPLESDLYWFSEWQADYGKTQPFEYASPRRTAAQLIIDLIHQYPNQLLILAIGPLTNLATALKQEPGIAGQVKEVIAMRGTFSDQPQEPEFNIHCDPHAAQKVFQAGWPLTLLGLEITRRVHFSRDDFASLPNIHPAIRLLRQQAAGWIDRVEAKGWEKDGCSLHDAVAAAYLLHPEIFKTQLAKVKVSIGGEHPDGTTTVKPVLGFDEQNITIVTEVNAAKCKEIIWSAIKMLALDLQA